MPHENMLVSGRTALAIIDMQEAFRPFIVDFAETAGRIAVAARAAQLLDVPILITEQYPPGLGRTAAEVQAALPAGLQPVEKTVFSCCGAPGFVAQLEATGARQILLCGIEAHICVNQTAHDLLARGYQVHLLTDGITSRAAHNKEVALAKMQQSGALLSTVEMALFELLRDAQHEQFKAIQKLIR